MSEFRPPSPRWWDVWALPRVWHRPVFEGLEHVDPERPALYVGNHTLFGVLDASLMVLGLHRHRGVYLRGLGDRAHFRVPGWRRLLRRLGAVEGTREACGRLMQEGAHVLVFPGGGREVVKRKGEQYRLIWKERAGFAHMAKAYDYPIVPFGAVGAEECFTIVRDAEDAARGWDGALLRRTGLWGALRQGEMVPPLAYGWGGTPLPRPERMYFGFGAPLNPSDFVDVWSLRESARVAVEGLLAALRGVQADDRERRLSGWVRGAVGRRQLR